MPSKAAVCARREVTDHAIKLLPGGRDVRHVASRPGGRGVKTVEREPVRNEVKMQTPHRQIEPRHTEKRRSTGPRRALRLLNTRAPQHGRARRTMK